LIIILPPCLWLSTITHLAIPMIYLIKNRKIDANQNHRLKQQID